MTRPFTENDIIPPEFRRGRGARSRETGRFEAQKRERIDDGWGSLEQEMEPVRTFLMPDKSKSVITRNTSPDIPFRQGLNPYRGCEHGCIYCYARPSHTYLGFSAGLDFETRLMVKYDAARVLEQEFRHKNYKPDLIVMGGNTDIYQPIEKKLKITRQLLKVFDRFNHPVGLITKSALVTRDIDILKRLARKRLVRVYISVTTLDYRLARNMEPRASTPQKRLDAIRDLAKAGIPVGVMAAPVIPSLTDHELENILAAARAAGARSAGYIMLRLPLEIKKLFREWLEEEAPDRARRIIHLLQEMHGGKDYSSSYSERMRGSGPYADLVAQRFKKCCFRLGLNQRTAEDELTLDLFQPPLDDGTQMSLF
ncbi:PA0069 family radical SAM protein [Emcibacter nanhaiensis]|uniref:PA0069 family radical SAM protein n=1 Tax=Emcibacter nanhaiensis TaxID=1505037 RepID=A0A501PI25_9PROT|nr:PA0069 family radical SAM protein [Emcibacter nanhaiensis]TPD59496.1 PA0069 family radical SAM protein [Emcibacter nanhaiensis]